MSLVIPCISKKVAVQIMCFQQSFKVVVRDTGILDVPADKDDLALGNKVGGKKFKRRVARFSSLE